MLQMLRMKNFVLRSNVTASKIFHRTFFPIVLSQGDPPPPFFWTFTSSQDSSLSSYLLYSVDKHSTAQLSPLPDTLVLQYSYSYQGLHLATIPSTTTSYLFQATDHFQGQCWLLIRFIIPIFRGINMHVCLQAMHLKDLFLDFF